MNRAILIVEDDERYRRSLKRALKGQGYQFYEAGSVKEAKDLLTKETTPVILLDLELPVQRGTELLDHIKDRAARYRVIILTGHGELLAADEAFNYGVFAFIDKAGKLPVTSLRIAVERAFQDIEKDQETVMEGRNERDVEAIILTQFPSPFANIFQELTSKLEPVEKFLRQVDLLDLLVRFSAIVLLCEYLNGSNRDPKLDEQIRGTLSRPSLGQWYNLINDVLRLRPEADNNPVHKTLAKVYNRKFKTSIQRLIQIRNKNLGHGAKQSTDEYIAISAECESLLQSVLYHFQFIIDYLLCHVSTVKRVKDDYIHKLLQFQGVSHQFLYSERTFHIFLHAEQMLLVNLQEEAQLHLHPFVVLEYADEYKQRELFFYDMFENDNIHYLSYKAGHRLMTKKYVEDLVELVGEIKSSSRGPDDGEAS